ncbi:MAG TPA: response regulator transcription factor [Acidimicrobiales bacterium]|nr:response regulator transcription factor [Acidimicrobiales bacterium]
MDSTTAARSRVLIVDDEPDVRFMARTVLELDGRYEVVGEGASGVDAIELAAVERPDIVLLDLEMPWLHGAEAVPHIRRLSPETVIVLWTVAPDSARVGDAMAMGASLVLDKSMFAAIHLPERLYQSVMKVRRAGVR